MHAASTLTAILQRLVLLQHCLQSALLFSSIAGAITVKALNSVCSRPATGNTWPTVDWDAHQKNLIRKNPGKRFILPVRVCCAAPAGNSTSTVKTLYPQTGQPRWRKTVSAVSRQLRSTPMRSKSHLAHRILPLPVFHNVPNMLVRNPIHFGQLIKRKTSSMKLPDVQRVLRRQNCVARN